MCEDMGKMWVGHNVGEDVGRMWAWVRRVGGEREHGCAGGKELGKTWV